MTTPLLPVVEDVPQPRAWGYQARIDDILVQLAVNPDDPTQIVTAEAVPARVDTGEAAEDYQDDTGFRYSRNRLDGGAGFDFLHSPDRLEGATRRFWDSFGVDVFASDLGQPYEAKLMNEMLLDTAISPGEFGSLARIDDQIYYLRGDEIWEYGASPAKATLAAAPGSYNFLAMGNSLYSNDSTTGVLRFDPPSFTPVAVDTVATYTKIYGAKSRILARDGNELWEAGTTPILLLTLPPADEVVDQGVVDAGNSIVVMTTTGIIYLLGLDPSLALVNTGQYNFGDEIPVVGAFAQGVLGIATREITEAGGQVVRFYTASIPDDGSTLENVTLIFQVGDRQSTGFFHPFFMLGTRDSIYTVIATPGVPILELYRFYLPTGGWSRAHQVPVPSAGGGVSALEIDDRMWVANPSNGLWKEQDTFVDSGYVIGPAADFFTARAKQWVSGDLTIPELPPGTQVNLFDSTNIDVLNDPNHPDWELAVKVQVPGESEVSVDDLTGRNGRYHVAKVELTASADNTITPGFRSYSFRAFPSSDRDTIVRLPVNVSDQFEAPGKRAMLRRGRGIVLEQALRALEGKQVTVEVFALGIVLRGILERIEEPIVVFPERGSGLRVMFITIQGEDIAGAAAGFGGTSSGASWGQDKFAVPQFAVGELS
jgi:hypothetical protein